MKYINTLQNTVKLVFIISASSLFIEFFVASYILAFKGNGQVPDWGRCWFLYSIIPLILSIIIWILIEFIKPFIKNSQ